MSAVAPMFRFARPNDTRRFGTLCWNGVTSPLYVGCALYGLGVGNAITFPSLIVQTEYSKTDFNRVLSLTVAINQITFAFGPAILGWTRDRWGSYGIALAICAIADVAAAIIVLAGRRRHDGARRERAIASP